MYSLLMYDCIDTNFVLLNIRLRLFLSMISALQILKLLKHLNYHELYVCNN